jgi:hypothetical protein
MVKKFKEFLGDEVSAGGFKLFARDAHTTAKTINLIFKQRTSWFRKPAPINIDELCYLYKELCPDMELHHPGVIDKIFHPAIISKLGYPVDSDGMVHWQ